MLTSIKANTWLGLLAVIAGMLLVFVWIPLDVDTGIIEKIRRQTTLGDAFAPTVAATLIGLGGLLLLFERHTDSGGSSTSFGNVFASSGTDNVKHAAWLLIILTAAMVLMRYSGPLMVKVINGESVEYRLLRDTIPWKYNGFAIGGFTLVTGLAAYAEGRLRPAHVLIAIVSIIALTALYDLPFDDLLLPPNGDF